jgi:hypothetical protein
VVQAIEIVESVPENLMMMLPQELQPPALLLA